MKKYLLLTMLLAAMMPSSAYAQVTVTIPDIVAPLNQEITVPVTLANVAGGPAIESYQIFPVSSSPNIVFMGGDKAGTLSAQLSSASCLAVSAGGPIDRCSGFGGNISTSGILVNLRFKIIGSVTGGTVSLNNFLLNGPSAPAITPLTPVINVSLSALPSVSPDAYSVNEGNTLTVNAANGVSANDLSGSPMTVALNTSVQNGTLALAPDGSFVYTHNGSETASDSFTYIATNTTGSSSSVLVTITVTPVNDSPVADNKTVSTPKDTATTFALSGSDAEGSALAFTIISGPSSGVASITGSNVTYTPTTGFTGSDSFTYVANDGTVNSAVATVSITVFNPNTAPVVSNGAQTLLEDSSVNIALVATDTDLDPLTYTITTQPSNGTLVLTGSSALYTPNSNYFGLDSFSFQVNDGKVNSGIGVVSLTITSVNDAPVSSNLTINTAENVAVTFNLLASDIEQTPLSYTIVSTPSNGTATLSGATVSYSPNPGYFGADTFTYSASDGSLSSNVATVTVAVSGVNDAPTVSNINVSTNEDETKAIVLTATDIDGDVLVFTVSQPSNGTVTLSGSTATYVPSPNFNGSDSFTFSANDGTVSSSVATVTIAVAPTNDAPIVSGSAQTTNEDTALDIPLTGSDVDGDLITFSVVSGPSNGTVVITGSTAKYTPVANYVGTDSFTFSASDGTAVSSEATISITVLAVNDAPVVSPVSANTNEDVLVELSFVGSDSEGSPLVYSLVDLPTNGSALVSGSRVRYTPNQDFNGQDTFTYKANDGVLDSAPALITITVIPVNDVPVFQSQSVETTNDASVTITLTAVDPDGDPITYSLSTSPIFGSATVTNDTAVYTANAGFVGTDSFGVVASDGSLSSEPGLVIINVSPAKTALVQLVHAGGGGLPPQIDVYYKGEKVANGLVPRTGTALITLPLGGTQVRVAASPSSNESEAVVSFPLSLVEGQVASLVFAGIGNSPDNARMINSMSASKAASNTHVDLKFVHASATTPVVSVSAISDDSFHFDLFTLASNRTFESAGPVVPVAPSVHQFRVSSSGVSSSSLGVFRFDLTQDSGAFVTVVAVGQPGGIGSDEFSLFGITSNGSLRTSVVTTTRDSPIGLPTEFVLRGNYPNPFNPSTTIQFDLPESADVQVDVLDLLGRTMISIPTQSFEAGAKKSVSVDASALSSGIYMYRVIARSVSQTHVSTGTMTLIK